MRRFPTSPDEMLGSLWRNRQLVRTLIRREVLGRYRGSIMGVLWSFITPILMLTVYTFVFSVVFKARWTKYDPNPSVDYRQHDQNQVGANSTFRARFKRLLMLQSGRFQKWNDQHIVALERCKHILSAENRVVFEYFKLMREEHFPRNLQCLFAGKFYRQTLAGNLGLVAGVILRKI